MKNLLVLFVIFFTFQVAYSQLLGLTMRHMATSYCLLVVVPVMILPN